MLIQVLELKCGRFFLECKHFHLVEVHIFCNSISSFYGYKCLRIDFVVNVIDF